MNSSACAGREQLIGAPNNAANLFQHENMHNPFYFLQNI
jgi:hypothetical protein